MVNICTVLSVGFSCFSLPFSVEWRTGGDFWQLQHAQNNLVRVVCQSQGRTDARPLLHSLHWLLVRQSPINWLYWLTRCGPQPLQRISASWYRPMHHLGLCALLMLVVPRIHTELAHRAFSVAAPSTWNSLPADIRLCDNIFTFKCHLKTHLFKLT